MPGLILRKMIAIAGSERGPSPYGMVISRIIDKFEISFLGAKIKNLSYFDTIDDSKLVRMGYEYSNGTWVLKHKDDDEDGDEDVPPTPTHMDMRASFSVAPPTMFDIMASLQDMRMHFDSRLDSIDTHLGEVHTELRDIHDQLD